MYKTVLWKFCNAIILLHTVFHMIACQNTARIELNPTVFEFKLREFVDFSLKLTDVQVSLKFLSTDNSKNVEVICVALNFVLTYLSSLNQETVNFSL